MFSSTLTKRSSVRASMSSLKTHRLSSGATQDLYALHMQRSLWAANGSNWQARNDQRHLSMEMTRKQAEAGSSTNKRDL